MGQVTQVVWYLSSLAIVRELSNRLNFADSPVVSKLQLFLCDGAHLEVTDNPDGDADVKLLADMLSSLAWTGNFAIIVRRD